MQAAAVRRVHADRALALCEPGVGSALGAMAMDHVGRNGTCAPCDMRYGSKIARARLTTHRYPSDVERKLLREIIQGGFGLRSASRAVGDQTNPMPARRLPTCEISHVPEKPAHRRAQYVKNV